jgi:tetratricopeptide (TPR) repeat protein
VTETPGEIAAIRMSRERYLGTGDLDALDESVRLGRSAIARLSGSGALEGAAALELAASLGVLYEADGQLQRVEEALGLLDRAVGALPPGHADLAAVHTNIAGARLRRFAKLGDRDDLESAIAAARRGVQISEPGDPGLAIRYANLTGALRTLYEMTGELAVLDESISQGRAASAALQPSTQAGCMVLATLAGSLQARFLRAASSIDLAQSIETARRAVASAPFGSPWRVAAVSILAAGLRSRFEMTGDVKDLSEAIALHREMADQVPSQHPEHALHLLQVAATLLLRFEHLRVWDDLDAADEAMGHALQTGNALTTAEALRIRAICLQKRCTKLAAEGSRASADHAARQAVEAAKQALEFNDPADSSREDRLIQVCTTLAVRFEITHTAAHRAEAISTYEDALERLGDNGPTVQLCKCNLGRVYQLATESGPASRADIDTSIDLFRQVLAAADPGRRVWVAATLGLLRSLAQLFQIDHEAVEVGAVVRLYQQLAGAPAAPSLAVARAGLLTGALLMVAGTSADAAGILTDAVRLLPAIAWRGIDRGSRESQLAELAGLGCDAAASQLAAGHAEAAVEVVEQGRSVLWADILQLRRGDADLWQEHPEQATRLRDLAAALDIQEILRENHGISRDVDRRMVLATEWEELVAQVHEQGSKDFLEPARLADLLPATANGPVAIVNVSQYRCDALLITSEGVRSVELPLLSAQDVTSYTDRYLGAHARVDRAIATNGDTEGARRDLEKTLLEVLAWLWDSVAEPVLTALGFGDAPAEGQPWSRIWWCPTGLLTLLPLHAAGYYASEADSPPRTVVDRVVPSYTPTLGALADANRAALHRLPARRRHPVVGV